MVSTVLQTILILNLYIAGIAHFQISSTVAQREEHLLVYENNWK
uniref:Uncharacterized protein n=1 Tax=Arundo donax TaxID=35708 RepID=A0A0A9DXY4_ARUDO